MKDYEEIKVPISCSISIGLLKQFDMIAKKKGFSRSGMVANLIKLLVEKEKKVQ